MVNKWSLELTPNEFKSRFFPNLGEMVYLASCSLSACSNALDNSMHNMLKQMIANDLAWTRFENKLNHSRQLFAKLINAHPNKTAILPNASICAYQVLSKLKLKNRSKLVFSLDEFPSIAHVWRAQSSRTIDFSIVEGGRSRHATIENYFKAFDDRTALVSIPYTSYQSGKLQPVKKIISKAKQFNAKVFVDAYQAAGVEPIDVEELNIDYLVEGL